MRSKSLGILLIDLTLAACAAGTDPNTVDVSGRWTFTETFEDVAHGMSCTDSGSYDITQVGDKFSGVYFQRGACITPNGTVDNTDSGTVHSGRVIGRTLRFMVTQNCDYEGSVSGMPAETLAGRGVCVLQDIDRTLNFSGTWQATR